mmetsp:Transcript_28411/g.44173  ORF Transcript_28411/g.44173 Transcript_28411/m.44173 type:complete len:203 (+) Transcript_28411:585-1193(+)
MRPTNYMYYRIQSLSVRKSRKDPPEQILNIARDVGAPAWLSHKMRALTNFVSHDRRTDPRSSMHANYYALARSPYHGGRTIHAHTICTLVHSISSTKNQKSSTMSTTTADQNRYLLHSQYQFFGAGFRFDHNKLPHRRSTMGRDHRRNVQLRSTYVSTPNPLGTPGWHTNRRGDVFTASQNHFASIGTFVSTFCVVDTDSWA